MLIQYTIYGDVLVNQSKVVAEYTLRNLTTGFVSKKIKTIPGYYSVNLANFDNTEFNNGDVISLEFEYTDTENNYYFTRLYFVINKLTTTTKLNALLIKDWNYSVAINVVKDDTDLSKVTVNFITNLYRNILYKLYYKFDGVYREISSVMIDKQTIVLNFPHSGDYMIKGYIVFGSMLTAYANKEFTLEVGDTLPYTNTTQNRYIEWE